MNLAMNQDQENHDTQNIVPLGSDEIRSILKSQSESVFEDKNITNNSNFVKNEEDIWVTKLNIKEPTVEIYNLENFLLDLEKSPNNLIQKVKFFPPYSSYQSSSRNIEDVKIESSENKKIKKILNEKVKSVQRFCKGVIWLVTSDTLPSEENSW